MNYFFIVYLIIIFKLLKSCGNPDIPKVCGNDICLTEDSINDNKSELHLKSSALKVAEKFYFPNSTEALEKDEIYMIKNQQIVDPAFKKNSYTYKLQTESPGLSVETSSKLFFSTTEDSDVTNEIFYSTIGTEKVTENAINEQSKSVSIPTTETGVTNSSISTTQAPSTTTHSLLKENFSKGNICFCDLKVNECDINCCCDEDCTQSHFKVFTKCINNDHLFESDYCYNNYFIFANNTSQKIIQKQGGLFCIARENVKVSLNYETKPALKTLEAFNKTLPKKLYAFSYKTDAKLEFKSKDYVAGSPVWIVRNEELKPFRIPYSSLGFLCNSDINVKYMIDQVTTCFIKLSSHECQSKKIRDVLQELKSIEIVSRPSFINLTKTFNSSKVCEGHGCIKITSFICQEFDDGSECLKVTENSTEVSHLGCWNALSNIEYQIWHNGSQGILKLGAQLWLRKISRNSKDLLPLITDVQFKWVGSSDKVFKRSGNPGYLIGKPVLAGRKIYVNETSEKKEAMEVSANPNDWLNVLGSKKGLCSFRERIPINFRENGQYTCSVLLTKDNFTKEKCLELQNTIYKLLLGQDIINATKENYFNKFVATFGNSKVEETGDWVQVLIDLFFLSSSQASFKSNHYHLMCKNIITDLYIDIVYSNIGSVLAPQAKILGVSFRFGNHKDLTYYCDSPGCQKTFHIQYFKLSTSVNFVDISKPATDAFAEPLHLEAKLPHNFFYPFFSKGSRCQVLSKVVCLLILSAYF